eukprot:gene16037-19021_t
MSDDEGGNFFDEQAVRSGSEDADSSDDEQPGQDQFEQDGFVVDEDEEEEEDSDAENRRKKKKKKRRAEEAADLDEEDYDLVAENTGQAVRPKANKRKRLQKAADVRGVDPVAAGFAVTTYAVQEAENIFDCQDLFQSYMEKKEKAARTEVGIQDLDDDEVGMDEHERLVALAKKKLEPAVIAENFYLPADEKIRKEDRPEREQLLEQTIGERPPDIDPMVEAEWIYQRLFAEPEDAHKPMTPEDAVPGDPMGHKGTFLRHLLEEGKTYEEEREHEKFLIDQRNWQANPDEGDEPVKPEPKTPEQDMDDVKDAIAHVLRYLHEDHLE